MEDLSKILKKYGRPFILNKNWMFHGTIYSENVVRIFNEGILTKKELALRGIREITDYDKTSQNGFNRVSLAIITKEKRGAYYSFVKDNDAVIVSDNVPVIRYKGTKIIPNTGIKKLFNKTRIYNIPLTSFKDEVQVEGCVDVSDIIGLKIGNISYNTIKIITPLLNDGKDITLYDLKSLRTLKASELIKRI